MSQSDPQQHAHSEPMHLNRPRYALLWSMAGDIGWTVVGLYDTKREALDQFIRWESVYDGLLVVSAVHPLDERHIANA